MTARKPHLRRLQQLWLTLAGTAESFQTTVPKVNMHLCKVYDEGEFVEFATPSRVDSCPELQYGYSGCVQFRRTRGKKGGPSDDHHCIQRRIERCVLRRPPSIYFPASRLTVHRGARSAHTMRFTDDHFLNRAVAPEDPTVRP
jgi:hypothetical protein